MTTVSANVVSVLQAGAFFGALGSAPISGESIASWWSYCEKSNPVYSMVRTAVLQYYLFGCVRRRSCECSVLNIAYLI